MGYFLCNKLHIVCNFSKRNALSARKKTLSRKESKTGGSSKSEGETQLESVQLLGVVSKKNVNMEKLSK